MNNKIVLAHVSTVNYFPKMSMSVSLKDENRSTYNHNGGDVTSPLSCMHNTIFACLMIIARVAPFRYV